MTRAALLIAGVLTLAAAAPADAAPKKADPKASADTFSLDLAPVEEDGNVTAPSAENAAAADAGRVAAPAPDPSAAPARPSRRKGKGAPEGAVASGSAEFTIDTPIAKLLANYRSKAVLDKDMPGLSTDKNLDQFKARSLRELAPLSGGRLTDDLLEKVGRDLARTE